ncbi:TPA: single-stranded-DNA-specific exonuclease RecJ [Candidatus Poribacteria bacterium]|nr:single-stranded-DNA-specific exonuclease RecJ [Candidatus Poribacteria bacterium]
MRGKIWRIKKTSLDISLRLADRLRISPLLARVLVSRGYNDVEAARRFLHPSLNDLHDPFLLPDMDRAVERIRRAISSGEKIWIYGDYDVDGTAAVSALMLTFRRMGVETEYYIPNRLIEGYGLNRDAIAELKDKGCDLLITVDCGISAYEEIEYANEIGMDVIVTDHHYPKGDPPPACCVINPKLPNSSYPFKDLAGVGVAFKLIQALMSGVGDEEFPESLLDLVALGTIVDVTPLTGENRVLARFGLERLTERERIGIKALCDSIGLSSKVRSYHVSFLIGPRLNASGRLDTAHSVVELLTTDSYERAYQISLKLNADNLERQKIESQILAQATDMVVAMDLRREKGIVLASERWHRGVVGIVASRTVERFYRPAILIAVEEGEGHGSGRSIPEFDLFEGISRCADLLIGFGGHRAAAGIKIERERIPEFRRRFNEVVGETLSEEDLTPKVEIDVETPLHELNLQLVEEMELLEPFGLGNPSPLFAVRNVLVSGSPTVMRGDHLRFYVTDGAGETREVIGWNQGRLQTPLSNRNISLDIAFQPRLNEWGGVKRLRLDMRDIQIHQRDSLAVYPSGEGTTVKLVDRRHIPDKFKYLERLIDRGEKVIIYVRGEPELERLAEELERRSDGGNLTLIREKPDGPIEGDVIASCVVLPPQIKARHIVFCHPVPSRADFVRMCRPAFLSDDLTYIHLIFNQNDVQYAVRSVFERHPGREDLEKLYRSMRRITSEKGEIRFEDLKGNSGLRMMREEAILKGMEIFRELGLIEDGPSGTIRLKETGKVSLSDSETFIRCERAKYEASIFLNRLLWRSITDLWEEMRGAVRGLH